MIFRYIIFSDVSKLYIMSELYKHMKKVSIFIKEEQNNKAHCC